MQYITGIDIDLHNKELGASYEKWKTWKTNNFNPTSYNISFKQYMLT